MGLEFDFSQVQAKLEELDSRVAKNVTDKALKQGAQFVLDAQRITVPKKTGKLEQSLIVGKISGRGAKRKILIGIDPAKARQVVYGYYQEYGTKVMLGKKWMKTAWVGSRAIANKEIGKSIAEDLRNL